MEVLLVDDHPELAPPTEAPRSAPGARRPGRRWLVAAAVLAVLLVVLSVVDSRADRRERAAVAAAAGVPGVLGSFAEPLREVWRLPTRADLTGLGDRIVTVDDGSLVGLDGATGELRWSIPLVGSAASCPVGVPPVHAPPPGQRDIGQRDGGQRDGGQGDEDDGADQEVGGPTSGSLICFGLGRPEAARGGVIAHAVDAEGGEVRAELRGSRLLIGATALERDAVLVGSGAGKVIVSRTDLETGRARWAVDARGIEPGVVGLLLHADARVVALQSTTTVVLDARDGRMLGRWVTASDGLTSARARVVSHPGAGFGVWESRFSGRWHGPDGTPGVALDGEPLEPEIGDGRTPGVVLLGPPTQDSVRAVDVRTGDRLWERSPAGRLLLHLDGRLVVAAEGRLEAWDVTTGQVQWSVRLHPSEDPVLGEPWTDGVRLVVRGEDDGGPFLTAYRLADGKRIWRTALPAGSRSLMVLGDRLAAVGRFDGRVESAAVLG